jgi:hypothetical protein
MKYKLMSLFMISLLCLSIVGASSAYQIEMDGDWRLVHKYAISCGGYSTTYEVAGSDSHSFNIPAEWQNKQIIISLTYRGNPRPNHHSLLVNFWNGHSNIIIDGWLSYNSRCYYESGISWKANDQEGWTSDNAVV